MQVGQKCSNIGSKAELGRYPFIINICTNIVKFWIHALKSDAHSLIYQAAVCDKNDNVCGFYQVVKKILNGLCDPEKVIDHDISTFGVKLKTHLMKKYERTFFDKINPVLNKSNKLREYQKVKKVYKFEKYLYIKNKEKAKSITKVRLSSNNFPIELGRRYDISAEKRFCFMCNNKQKGDEKHMLLLCPNIKLFECRNAFLNDIMSINHQLLVLTSDDIYHYILSAHDDVHTYFKFCYFHIIKNRCCMRQFLGRPIQTKRG